ncbi:MAG: hypothetical protein IT249_07975 [Chitinophagaceae bacterium]|nr:hypothetical protein [Chitinophagaceae bacterium]
MKSLAFTLLLSIALFSCSKKDNNSTPKEGIARIEGNYSGESLSWERTVDGAKTSGTDANASFSIVYKNKKATVTVNTSATLTNKTYEMALISDENSNNGYIFQSYENSETVQNNSALRVTITTKTSAQIDFNKTFISDGKTISERYSLNGYPQNN